MTKIKGLFGTTEQAAEKLEKQVPRLLARGGLVARDDKSKGLATAQLKLRPFKTAYDGLFPRPVKPQLILRDLRTA
jgi:hypothetical protein